MAKYPILNPRILMPTDPNLVLKNLNVWIIVDLIMKLTAIAGKILK